MTIGVIEKVSYDTVEPGPEPEPEPEPESEPEPEPEPESEPESSINYKEEYERYAEMVKGYNKEINNNNNGWSYESQNQLEICLWKLRYNRIINNFYFSEIKKKEGKWSWRIILISTLTSGLTLANNVEKEPVKYYHLSINIALTVFSMTTSLIAAWIKKQQYIEKINTVDRYFQKLNKLCEEVDIELIKLPEDRMKYKDFKDKMFPSITEYIIPNPSITPIEWKKCVYEITRNYPEMLWPDNNEDTKMWPWYGEYEYKKDDFNNIINNENGLPIKIRKKTNYQDNVLKTSKNVLWRCFCLNKT